MSGNYLLDTNFVIYGLNNALVLRDGEYAVSIITEMELLSFPKLTTEEELAIKKLLAGFEIVNIDLDIKYKTIEIRKRFGIKLSDSIICASAACRNLVLVTNDKRLLQIDGVNSLSTELFLNRGTL